MLALVAGTVWAVVGLVRAEDPTAGQIAGTIVLGLLAAFFTYAAWATRGLAV